MSTNEATKPRKLDERTFDDLQPKDQAYALLTLLFLDSQRKTLGDLDAEFKQEAEREKYR